MQMCELPLLCRNFIKQVTAVHGQSIYNLLMASSLLLRSCTGREGLGRRCPCHPARLSSATRPTSEVNTRGSAAFPSRPCRAAPTLPEPGGPVGRGAPPGASLRRRPSRPRHDGELHSGPFERADLDECEQPAVLRRSVAHPVVHRPRPLDPLHLRLRDGG